MSNLPLLDSAKSSNEEFDVSKLFSILMNNIWLIVFVITLFGGLGVANAILPTPIYKADALLQVESKNSGMSALVGEMGDMFSNESTSTTEIEIIKSRMILGKTVDKYNLTIVATPIYFPYFGKGLSRLTDDKKDISVSLFKLGNNKNTAYKITLIDNLTGEYQFEDIESGELIFKGKVGEIVNAKGFSILVSSLQGVEGDEYTVGHRSRFDTIQWLKGSLSVSERGAQSGILSLSFIGEDKELIQKILNDVSQNYFLQNVQRNSAEAQKSLDFLHGHLPNIKSELMSSEDILNKFMQENESIDLSMEAQSTLNLIVDLEGKLNELVLQESEISNRFTKDHPTYQALLDKRKVLESEQKKINNQVKKLPRAQRDVLRMKRDVEVNQQIYIQLLNKSQELNILKAGTVGNVRILDDAKVYSSPIKPRKTLIVFLTTMVGVAVALMIVFLKEIMHKGIESPDEIEEIGLSVYASIPMSNFQTGMDIKSKRKNGKNHKRCSNLSLSETLLAVANPADLSIEALRGLRTSMHFAMMEAKNNIVMISGPAPGIGKSFVSVNFAAVMAKTGQKVLIVDADLRKGYLHQKFGLHWTNGLSDFLSGKEDLSSIIKKTEIDSLDVITRGQVPPNPSELLMNDRFSNFIDQVSNQYDLILIDTPPVLAVTDPSIVGAFAGTTLMVGRFGVNTSKEVEVARHRFLMAGVEVKGFILNAVEKKASISSGYGYYNYNYESDT
ncbi:tyrosine protein kinase [Marinomonas sp. S3726]|uniref:polysaccharide biosynthesis tyrosine autokinase n=1 Tax=Marinomonas sp. S3726 TaxID=579484 RepID=UPI0005FA6045|nr:polysaccharide biosynthesis tyrosine autokinase [Marinomonas sp. S3726]KJZ13728.1 tyrosine protein kinase [Marinomonas sp. S3726]